MRDALKNYLDLASGLTEVGRQRAVAASKALVAQGEATVEQVGSLAEDLLETSRHNRALITALVRNEVEKAITKIGPATAGEVKRLTQRLQSIESMLRRNDATPAAPAKAPTKPAARKPVAKKPATKAAAKPATKPAAKAPAKKAATKPAARKPAATKAAKPAKKKAGA